MVKLSASCASVCTVQVDPPLVEYSTVTYAVDPELICKENVEVFEPAEQEPSLRICKCYCIGPLLQAEASISYCLELCLMRGS